MIFWIDWPVLVECVGVADDKVLIGDFLHEEVHLGEVGRFGNEFLTVILDVVLVMVFADFRADIQQQASRTDAGVIDLEVFVWGAVFETFGDDTCHQGGQLVWRVEGTVFLRFGRELPNQVLVDIAEYVIGARLSRYLRDEVDDVTDRLVAAAEVLAELGETGVEGVEYAGMMVYF